MDGSSHIIASGSELVSGLVGDDNSPWLARGLCLLGFPPRRILLVPDDGEDIRRALEDADGKADVAVITGGLGPTDDDRTREAVADFAQAALLPNEELEKRTRTFYESRGRRPGARALRQALLPAGARPLLNPAGTAAGFFLDARSLRVVVLPGPPRELRATAGEDFRGLASALPGPGEDASVLRLDTFGLPESDVDGRLEEVRKVPGLSVATLASHGEVAVVLGARGAEAGKRVEAGRRAAETSLGRWIVGEGGRGLVASTARLFMDRGVTVALAESLTGGLAGHLLTGIPGVSSIFLQGVVAYADRAKIERLGVPEDVLAETGAVSAETAAAMAAGVARTAGADLGVSTTGIAGPEGGSPAKPVGLVFVACWFRGREEVRKLMLGGMDRSTVKWIAALSALDLARKVVLAAPL